MEDYKQLMLNLSSNFFPQEAKFIPQSDLDVFPNTNSFTNDSHHHSSTDVNKGIQIDKIKQYILK